MSTLYIYTIFWTCVIGLCIGSFLNVVIIRAFDRESIISPASKCPKCNTPLKWYHNIPLFSYIFLRGKCAFCHEKISIQYPIVEFTTMLFYLITFLKFGYSWNTLALMVIIPLFIIISVTDIKEQVIFDAHSYTFIGLALLYNCFNIGHLYEGKIWILNSSLVNGIVGLILGIIILELLARIGYIFVGKRAFGEGDTYIAAGLGALLGWKLLIPALVYGFILQVVLVIPLYLWKLFKNKDFSTMLSLILFFLYSILFKYLEMNDIFRNNWIFLPCAIILMTLGIWLCRRLLNAVKNPENLTYLPYGPAMFAGALIVIYLIH